MRSHLPLILFILFPVFLCTDCINEIKEPVIGNLDIAPLPVTMVSKNGALSIDSQVEIVTDNFSNLSFDPLKVFVEVFERKSGYKIPVMAPSGSVFESPQVIHLTIDTLIGHKDGYTLKVNLAGIRITAASAHGLFYALQTLRQIMRLDAVPDANNSTRQWSIPFVEIADQPTYSYREMHLDVARHYMSVEFVKKYIDLLAFYKMNNFHWHLTDDQGWRIEIKKYPKLQEIAAWRDETLAGHYSDEPVKFDGQRHGGFYTQEQAEEVVAYAAERGVNVIPEIEMPGHAQATLAAYPELACTPGPFKVASTWGVFEDVFCPTEVTFTFLQNVIDEVIEIFPSKYIHIGGDECPKTRWKDSEFCQQLMKKEGLKDEHELQSYFIQRMEKYINNKGRKIIGWDEILEGGLAPDATVMSWRGMEGGIAAAKQSHDVIMSPGPPCYFDHYQADPVDEPIAIGGLTTLEQVYAFVPVPSELNPTEVKYILGGQANLWTEFIPDPRQAEYMAYPRAIALAEALWTPQSRKDWNDFTKRLVSHFDLLDGMEVNYAKHLTIPTAEIKSGKNGLTILWKSNVPDQVIYFSKDTTKSKWEETKAVEEHLIHEAGILFYKAEGSPVKKITYSPSQTREALINVAPAPDERYPGSQGAQTLGDGLRGNKIFNGKTGAHGKVIPLSMISFLTRKFLLIHLH